MAENSNKYSIAYPSAQSDANNFTDGVSIVTDPTNVSHLPATGARTVVFTNTLLVSPQRKVQFAQDLNSCYIRSLITTGWTAWEKLVFDSDIAVQKSFGYETNILSGATGKSGNMHYYKFGRIVYVAFLVWNFKQNDTTTDDQLILEAPFPAATIRNYGIFGYNNAALGQMYVYLSNQDPLKISIMRHNADGTEAAVTGNQMKNKTFQFSLIYFTDS